MDEARSLICRDWRVVFTHIGREQNHSADQLAKMSHNLAGNFCIYEQPPPSAAEGVLDDLG